MKDFKSVKLALAAGMVASPAVSTLASAVNNSIVFAKDESAAQETSLKKNFFLSFIENAVDPEGVTYQDGVIAVKDKVVYEDNSKDSVITISNPSALVGAKEGDVFILEEYEPVAKAFKIMSMKNTDNGGIEVIKSININTDSTKNIVSRIKSLPKEAKSLEDAMNEVGLSNEFVKAFKDSFDTAYSELFKDVDSVDTNSEEKVAEYVKSVNKRLISDGYSTSVYNIVSIIETLSNDNVIVAMPTLTEDEVKNLNTILTQFIGTYNSIQSDSGSYSHVYDDLMTSFKDKCSEIAANHIKDITGDNNTGTTAPSDNNNTKAEDKGDNSSSTSTDEVKTGDFSGEFTLTEIPAACNEQYLKTHKVTDETDSSKNHEYQYYNVVARDSDGKEISMMALANNENVDVLNNYHDGDKVTIDYTVSKCTDGQYDYVINKMTKVGSSDSDATSDATKTGENADTGLRNNNIYYVVGIGVAAVGLGALAYTKKKKQK